MCKFWLKYGLYGCILGLMGLRIWKRAQEESKINLRPFFHPDCAGEPVDTTHLYQDITPLGYGYVRRPIYRNEGDMAKAVADYSNAKETHIVCNGRSYPNAAALFQEMEQQATLRGGEGAKAQHISIVTERN